MIIDMHAHIYKEKIAQKAANSIGGFYGIAARCQGTTEELLRLGKKAGIDRFLVSSVATYPEQVKKINDFLFEEAAAHPELIAFATLHPLMEDMETELDRLEKMNFKGIKLHPDYQETFFNDIKYKRILAFASELGLIVSVHAGFDPGYPECVHCTPKMAREVIEEARPEKLVLPGQDLVQAAAAVPLGGEAHPAAHQRGDLLMAQLAPAPAGRHALAVVHIVEAAEGFHDGPFPAHGVNSTVGLLARTPSK